MVVERRNVAFQVKSATKNSFPVYAMQFFMHPLSEYQYPIFYLLTKYCRFSSISYFIPSRLFGCNFKRNRVRIKCNAHKWQEFTVSYTCWKDIANKFFNLITINRLLRYLLTKSIYIQGNIFIYIFVILYNSASDVILLHSLFFVVSLFSSSRCFAIFRSMVNPDFLFMRIVYSRLQNESSGKKHEDSF